MTIKITVEPGVVQPCAVRPKWRAPRLTEDAVADVTANENYRPGDDGGDYNPNYVGYGIPSYAAAKSIQLLEVWLDRG